MRIKRHVTAWLFCYLFLVVTYPPHGGGTNGTFTGFPGFYEMVFIRTFTMILCQMVFCYPLLYFLMPRYFWEKRYVQFIFLLLILWMCTNAVRFVIYAYVYNPIMIRLHLPSNPLPQVIVISMRQTFTGPAFVGALFITFKIFKDWRQRQADNFNLQKENTAAEMQLLKAQIHPHFLFNTLNNIYSFTLNKLPKAKQLVHNLNAIMYYMVNDCNVDFLPLNKEIKMLNDYIELEKVRYGTRLNIEVNIEGDYNNKLITPLLMIPFVENSFKHGTSKMLEDPWIRLFIQADENILHFSLTNGKPLNEDQHQNGRIGLNNVKKRLELLYPDNHLLLIESTANTFTVNMQIPLQKIEKEFVA